jgi:hypothetical protein
MKTLRATIVVGLIAAAGIAGLQGQDQAAQEATPRQVVVLSNETTLCGDIERDGEDYRIKTGQGETLIPAARVLRLCQGFDEAYQYLRGRANLRDADERIRLARWCLQNHLLAEARAEIQEALRLRPKHRDAQKLLVRIEAAERDGARPATNENTDPSGSESSETPERTPTGSEVVNTSRKQSLRNPRSESWSSEDLSQETVQTFVRRVQPILLNGCGAGHCHGGAKSGGYELIRPPSAAPATAALSRQNLASTLALLDKDFPEQSPLLTKALERHGGGNRPPLGTRDSAAYAALEAWVKKLTPSKPAEPVFREPEPASVPALDPMPTDLRPALPVPKPDGEGSPGAPQVHGLQIKAGAFTPGGQKPTGADVLKPRAIAPRKPASSDKIAGSQANPDSSPKPRAEQFLSRGEVLTGPDAKPKPEPEPVPVDPFDPLIFNRLMHRTQGKE